AAGFDVGLVLADDLVTDGLAVVLVLEIDGGAESHPVAAGRRRRCRIDDLRRRKLRIDFADAPFDEALLFTRSVVFGVLREIAMTARFGNRLDDPRTIFRL